MAGESEYVEIRLVGGRPVYGSVAVSGFKHSLVLSVAYLVGRRGPARITNVPDILETDVYELLLPDIGVRGLRREDGVVSWEGVEVNEEFITLPRSASSIHGSLYLLPALVSTGRPVRFEGFGGCQIGNGSRGQRPWRHVVDVMRQFGAEYEESSAGSVLHAPNGFHGADIDLLEYVTDREVRSGPEYSGATKTAVLAAALGRERSVLRGPYLKAELLSLLDVVESLGSSVVEISGRVEIEAGARSESSAPVKVSVPPDLLEAATMITAVGVAGGEITLRGIDRTHLERGLYDELKVWESVGVLVADGPDGVVATAPESGPLGVMPDLQVRPDGIYSDSHPLLAVMATRCEGDSVITDQVWTQRYGYADGLGALGGRVLVDRGSAHIGHSPEFRESSDALHATDLRCAAAYLLAALRVRGTTTITGAQHLRRGYSDLISKLRGIGVDIDAV